MRADRQLVGGGVLMRAIEAVLAVLMVLILWPAVLAAAVIPLLQDIAARRRLTHESAPSGSQPVRARELKGLP